MAARRKIDSPLLKKPFVAYLLVALAIMLPLLLPGHILTLDMALTPHLPFPDTNTSSFIFRLLLYLLNTVLPTYVIEKLLFFGILLTSGLGMHYLITGTTKVAKKPTLAEEWAVYIASTLYMINPFTYSRFMAGQYSVLLGYSVLPFFAWSVLRVIAKPGWKPMLLMTATILAISVFSIHTLGLVVVFMGCAIIGGTWRYRHTPAHVWRILQWVGVAIILFIVASSYWLIPLATGNSQAGQAIQGFGAGDQQAYATVGDGLVDKIFHVMRLQGFWVESRYLYRLPQDALPGWKLVTLGIWITVGAGAAYMFKVRKRFELFIFAGSGLIAGLVAASGFGKGLSGGLPILAGFREPQKFAGLVALAFAYCMAVGIPTLVRWFRTKGKETAGSAALYVLIILPVAWTPTMFWGFAGQLRPRTYPADWFIVNERLNQDGQHFRTLFLPWHLYMHFRFADRVLVNPAADFFDKQVIISNDPELGTSSLADQDTRKQKLSQDILPHAPTNPRLGTTLALEGIKYILLAKESDAQDYGYLERHPDIELIYKGEDILLFRNKAWSKP